MIARMEAEMLHFVSHHLLGVFEMGVVVIAFQEKVKALNALPPDQRRRFAHMVTGWPLNKMLDASFEVERDGADYSLRVDVHLHRELRHVYSSVEIGGP